MNRKLLGYSPEFDVYDEVAAARPRVVPVRAATSGWQTCSSRVGAAASARTGSWPTVQETSPGRNGRDSRMRLPSRVVSERLWR